MNLPNASRALRLGCALSCALTLLPAMAAAGTILKLKSGLEIRGNGAPGKIADLGANVLAAPSDGPKSIYVVDDGLKRTFVSSFQVDGYRDDLEALETIRIKQPVARSGKLAPMGPLASAPTGFDDWGRRQATLLASDGAASVVQGITEVTPIYTRVQGLQSDRPFIWDMRLRTSSIPGDVLTRVLRQHLDPENADDHLAIVRLFLQSGRYADARAELEETIKRFPELKDLKKQLVDIRRLEADKQIAEIELRRKAGQHHLVAAMLRQFPTKDVAGTTLAAVSELHEEYQAATRQAREALELVDSLLEGIEPGPRLELLAAFRAELGSWLSANTLNRLKDLLRLRDDESLNAEKKLALALSGWLLDGGGTDDMATATSLWTARGLTLEYLNSTENAERERIVSMLRSEQAGTPQSIARLLAAMRPPRELPGAVAGAPSTDEPPAAAAPSGNGSFPGLHAISVAGIKPEETFEYLIQLPPEYDPYRKYPAIVTLHGSATDPALQLDWWAGPIDEQQQLRTGQASRLGYIVIAPAWATPNQREYHYSAREHAAVLFSLRDAFQRFSIETDRVYLSGHSMGGDAAWDIALAHPDLWAGAIPIVATAVREGKRAPKYVSLYWENARQIPLLFIGGSMDGNRMQLNARDLNRYLTRAGIDATVVEYKGRGHEHFHEEIHDIFRWMDYHTREFFRDEFDVSTMRPWDNFFWWLEVADLPDGSIVLPAAWPPKNARAALVSGAIRGGDAISIKTGAAAATLWLSPELINLDQPVEVLVNGRKRRLDPTPDIAVLLEDARTRGDRLRPFWTKLELATGRANR